MLRTETHRGQRHVGYRDTQKTETQGVPEKCSDRHNWQPKGR
jgi:hypothetical protein